MPRPERPVDPAKGAIQEFAVALRELREDAGGPTYRSLADRTGLSVSTLADAAGGRRLPTFAVAVAYAVACGGDEQEWAARWRAVAEGQVSPERAPYRGMAGFRGEDADLFFGRERLVAEVVERVRERPVTVVLGASGAGKSSLLAAGLVPELTDFRPVVITPGEHPADRLPIEDDKTVLVIDQFEELYTLCAADERAPFLDRLLARTRGRVVLSVRADYFGRCAEHAGLAEVLRDNQVLVGPMTPDELREAISRPAAAVGLSVERALVATVVQEAKGRAGVLPLLSHAMLETWRKRRGTVLTLAGFQAAGGIDGAVLRTAEEAYGAFDPAQRALAAELLPRMLSFDESVARRRVDLADVLSVDPGAVAVIEALADARLVTVDGGTVEIAHDAMLTAWPRLRAWIDDHRDAVRAHRKISEAARIWAESDRDPSALASGGRLELMKAHSSALTGVLRLNQVEKDFLAQSDALAQQTALAVRRRTVRQRLLVLAAVVAVVVAATFAAVADAARTDALAARDIALSQQIASTVQTLRVTDPAVAAQLSIAGYREAATSEARSTLIESTGAPIPARYLDAGSTALAASADGTMVAVSDATDGSVTLFTRSGGGLRRAGFISSQPTGPDRPVYSNPKVYALAFAPQDQILAVGDSTATVSLWDVSNPHRPDRIEVDLSGAAGPIDRIAFDATGAELAAASGEQVSRWAVTDVEHPRELAGLATGARIRSVAYSPAGGRLVLGTDAGTAQVWTLGDVPAEQIVLESRDKPAPMVSFTPDGQLLLRGKEDDAIKLWDVSSATPRPGQVLSDLTDLRITTADFSPDGGYLVAGGADSTIYVLETRTWTVVRTLPHPDGVTSAAFTAGGDAVVTVATDGALRWWDLRGAIPPSAPGPIGELRLSADGTRLAVFADSEISLWDNNGVRLAPRLSGTFSGVGDLSQDGRWLAAGTLDGEVLLYDLADPMYPKRVSLGTTGKKVEAVAFNTAGTMLAAGGDDTSVRVWDLNRLGTPPATFTAPEGAVLDLAWRPSGRHLAVASADTHVYLLDAVDPAAPRQKAVLDGTNGHSTTFSADGRLLAASGADGVRLWDMTDPKAPRLLGSPVTGPTGRILDLSFNHDRTKLAASVIDGTVWLWNIKDPAHPARSAVLSETGSSLNTVTFGPTSDVLLAAGGDRVVHKWHTDERAVIADICAGVGEGITQREWRNHLPGVPYDPPCR